jgi:hypothetical protein
MESETTHDESAFNPRERLTRDDPAPRKSERIMRQSNARGAKACRHLGMLESKQRTDPL